MAGIAPPLSRTAAAGRRAGLIVLGVLAALPVGFVAAHLFDSVRSEEHTSELQSLRHLVCRLLLEKKKGYANHFYRSAHKFEQICRHRLRRQNVGYSHCSQPPSHLSFCVLLKYLVGRRRVVTQLGKLD